MKKYEGIVSYRPAAHALTVCDSVPMFGFGKIKVCSVIAKSPLQLLGEENADIEKIIQDGEMFVSNCYGVKMKTKCKMSEIR